MELVFPLKTLETTVIQSDALSGGAEEGGEEEGSEEEGGEEEGAVETYVPPEEHGTCEVIWLVFPLTTLDTTVMQEVVFWGSPLVSVGGV